MGEVKDRETTRWRNAWDVLSKYAGTVEGPEDWSEEHDHYLYDIPKRKKERK